MSIFFILAAGVTHAFLSPLKRQMSLNESTDLELPLINTLDCHEARSAAAKRQRPDPVPITAIFIGGRWIERGHS